MPELPTYNSKQNIQTSTTAPLRNNPPMLNEAASYSQDQQKILDTVATIGQKFSDANDVMQYTKAKTNASMAIAQQESAAKLDPNPENADFHLQEIQKAAKLSVDGISNQMVAQKASSEINADAFISSIRVNSIFKEKKMLANDISLGSSADLAAQQKSNAVTFAQGQQIEQDFLKTINENYTSGLITEGRARQLIDNYRMGEVKNDIIKENATQVGDSSVLTEIQKGNDGKYSSLSTDQRSEAERMVRLQVRENKEINTQQSMSTRVDTIKSIANGDLSWQNTNFISNIAQKDPNLAEALQKNFAENKSGKSYSAEDDKNNDFESLVGDIFKANTKEDINKYLLKALTPGMSMDRLSIIVNAAEQRGAKLPTMAGSTDGKMDQNQQAVDSAVKHIQMLNNGNILTNFFKGLFGGSSSVDASRAAINTEAIKNRPDLTANPATGKTMVDRYGNRAIVYPDGHFEEIKGEKKK